MNIYFTSIKGRRESNEDRHNIILNINELNKNMNNINLLGVYDGHGGSFVSTYLENKLPIYYCHPELKPPFSREYHNEIFKYLQDKILSYPKGHSSGSTCLLNLIYKFDNEIHMNIINLGDSRLSIVYKNGSCKQVTIDHKPDDPQEKIRLEKMGGEIYKDSEGTVRIGDLSLSRAFGDGDNAPYISQKPSIYYKKITPNTKYIIMACDGLWDVIANEELFSLIENFKKNNSTNLASDLANYALEKGSTDNISIILIDL